VCCQQEQAASLRQSFFLLTSTLPVLQTSFSVRHRPSSTIFAARCLAAALFALALSSWCAAKDTPKKSGATHADFHGWNAIVVSNGAARLVIVPDIGRVMEFDLLDDKGQVVPGPFWNHPAVDKSLPADAEGWKNFGGDKAWPSPQSEWAKIAGRGWPPPVGFDAVPCAATIKGRRVQLLSPVDSIYGVRVRRTITLDSRKPVVAIKTVYEKVRGTPVRMSVWTIA